MGIGATLQLRVKLSVTTMFFTAAGEAAPCSVAARAAGRRLAQTGGRSRKARVLPIRPLQSELEILVASPGDEPVMLEPTHHNPGGDSQFPGECDD